MFSIFTGSQKISFWILYILGKENKFVSKKRLKELLKEYHYHCAEEITEHDVNESLRRLREGDLVRSARGPRRGYHLNESRENITVYSVLESLFPMDFKSSKKECPVYHSDAKCPLEDTCRLKDAWLNIKNTLKTEAEKYSLDDALK